MQSPHRPDNETQRLRTLQSLRILDTPAEKQFDQITRVARRLFAVQIALVCGGLNIRFYARYPLQAPNGHKLGTLCIIDGLPRKFTAADRQLLCDLGALVEQPLRAQLRFWPPDPRTMSRSTLATTGLARGAVRKCGAIASAAGWRDAVRLDR